jgi:hypothetical protein
MFSQRNLNHFDLIIFSKFLLDKNVKTKEASHRVLQ